VVVAIARREVSREEIELRAFKASEFAEKLRELRKTEGWVVLEQIFEAAEKAYYDTVARHLMQGREINQRKLDFNRGTFEGVKQLLKQPERAETALVKALERLAETDKE
jgi:hypothetical protein